MLNKTLFLPYKKILTPLFSNILVLFNDPAKNLSKTAISSFHRGLDRGYK